MEYGCSENHLVNRYELAQEQKIAELTADKKLLESTIYTNDQLNQFRNYVDNRVAAVEARINAQDIYNATNTASLGCMANQIASINATIGALTKTVIPNGNVCPGWGAVTVSSTGCSCVNGYNSNI